MGDQARIIGLHRWLDTPAGRYLIRWEQEQLDQVVADLFGFHAVQLGMPRLQGLRTNRMPHRWVLGQSDEILADPPAALPPQSDGLDDQAATHGRDRSPDEPALRVAALTRFDMLPFPANSIDLIVLPHTLDLADDPHQTLREVERVLVPEGRVVVLGLNPASLWGLRQRWGRWAQRLDVGRPFLPGTQEFLGSWRLRDWLRLLSFEVEVGSFGCYRPALQSEKWLGRFRWMESAGDRWWRVLGAVYFLTAVKRVRGMRVIGPAWKTARKAGAQVAITPRMHRDHETIDHNR